MTLFVYGDSYAADDLAYTTGSWSRLVAQQLNCDLVMRAVSGSSTEYSVAQLVQDLDNRVIKPNSYVIFVVSWPGRLYFKHQLYSDPGSSSSFPFYDSSTLKRPEYKWFKDNINHLNWFAVNRDDHIESLQQESYIHALQSVAEANDLKLLLLTVRPIRENFGFRPTDNFFWPKICLDDVSVNEFIDISDRGETFADYTQFDPRNNHLVNTNRRLLAKLTVETFLTAKTDHWTLDTFDKNVIKKITNIAEYSTYVSNRVIDFNEKIHHILSR